MISVFIYSYDGDNTRISSRCLDTNGRSIPRSSDDNDIGVLCTPDSVFKDLTATKCQCHADDPNPFTDSNIDCSGSRFHALVRDANRKQS